MKTQNKALRTDKQSEKLATLVIIACYTGVAYVLNIEQLTGWPNANTSAKNFATHKGRSLSRSQHRNKLRGLAEEYHRRCQKNLN